MVSDNPATYSGKADVVGSAKKPSLGFVACIERGVLEAQALLLFESIRGHAGRLGNLSLYALSPRRGYAISHASRKRLDELGVEYNDAILNTECVEYGPANRVAAAAHVEATTQHDLIVVLDSDTFFLREPTEINLASDIDVAVRPVDLKGISTSGVGDRFDHYWRDLCRCCGVAYEQIPSCESFVDRQRIKANYNGGLIVARREPAILQRWADFFFRSVRDRTYPQPNGNSFRAGAGWVGPEAAKLWGSNQAALSLAIWSTTRRVRELPPTYNYPLHLHKKVQRRLKRTAFPNLVHVHYHYLFDGDAIKSNPLFARFGPLSDEQRQWLRRATPIN